MDIHELIIALMIKREILKEEKREYGQPEYGWDWDDEHYMGEIQGKIAMIDEIVKLVESD